MAAMARASSRYSSFNSTSSSADLSSPSIPKSTSTYRSGAKSGDIIKVRSKPEQNFTAMVRKFMEKKSAPRTSAKDRLIIPADFIAEDLKKTARKGSGIAALPKKLFGKSAEKSGSGEKKVKALTDVKANTRTLAMVLRSERELLSLNKEQESEICQLRSLLDQRSKEVEKLKDLCLKQREEIKSLKSAILFPEEMNSQLQVMLDQQGSELKQARQVIPTLQRQISSLTGQLLTLSEDLAQVKADKYSPRRWSHGGSLGSPRTLAYEDDDSVKSPDLNCCDPATPGSPDDMFFEDINPCLTPYSIKEKTGGFGTRGYESPEEETFFETRAKVRNQGFGVESRNKKLSRSSDCCRGMKSGRSDNRAACRSDESKYISRKKQ